MRFVVLSVVVAGVVGLSGCGVGPDDSKKLWRSIESSLGHNTAAGSRQQALSVGIDFDVDCADGGTASLNANLDVTTPAENAVNALFGYDVQYERCKPDENTLDGELRYGAVLVAGATDTGAGLDEQTRYQGSVTSSGESNGTYYNGIARPSAPSARRRVARSGITQ